MDLNKSSITSTDLAESRFVLSKFNNFLFDDDNLVEAEFNNTSLNKIDLSTCIITGLDVDVYHIRGVIINDMQAADLIGIYGITIKK